MRKKVFSIFTILAIAFTLFGVLGVVVVFPKRDVFGIIFYIVWVILGTSLVVAFRRSANKIPKMNNNISDPLCAPIDSPSAAEDHSFRADSPSEKPCENLTNGDTEELSFPNVYIALDLETPNRKNDSISQIGLLLIKNGKIDSNFSTLLNPESPFDPINSKLTGLNSSSVIHAPNLPTYWPHIEKLFESYVTVAHNASFDLSVLSKALSHYGIPVPKIRYVCTYVESMNKMPELNKHNLAALASHYNINTLKEHSACDDARVCHLIFENMKKDGFQFIISEYNNTICSDDLVEESSKNTTVPHSDIALPFSDCSEVLFDGKRFVLTGIFSRIEKEVISDYVTDHGGRVTSAVSGKTDYIIIGSTPAPEWKYGDYGSKIKKALELWNLNNQKPLFISEEHLLKIVDIRN